MPGYGGASGPTWPGKVCDLGTVLVVHSMSAWVTDLQGPAATHAIWVTLEMSHDGIHWHWWGSQVYLPEDGQAMLGPVSWPTRYVRATIVQWRLYPIIGTCWPAKAVVSIPLRWQSYCLLALPLLNAFTTADSGRCR